MVCAPVRKDNPLALARGLSTVQAHKTMLYLICTMISSVDLAHNGVSRAKDWVSVDCGTNYYNGRTSDNNNETNLWPQSWNGVYETSC